MPEGNGKVEGIRMTTVADRILALRATTARMPSEPYVFRDGPGRFSIDTSEVPPEPQIHDIGLV